LSGFDFLDFVEGMFPAVQILFKFIIFLMIAQYTQGVLRLATTVLFLLVIIWIYPDVKQIIKFFTEASK